MMSFLLLSGSSAKRLLAITLAACLAATIAVTVSTAGEDGFRTDALLWPVSFLTVPALETDRGHNNFDSATSPSSRTASSVAIEGPAAPKTHSGPKQRLEISYGAILVNLPLVF